MASIVRMKLKRVSLGAKWSGAVLLLLVLLGVFRYHERIEFYEKLQEKKELPANSAVARQLMQDFDVPAQQIKFIDEIFLRGLQYGAMGRSVSGNVVGKSKDGRTRTFADLMEFRSWAYSQSRLYSWLSFCLVLLALLIDTWCYVVEYRDARLG